MRVSPAPPLTAGANPPHPPHSPHMSPAVGGPGSVVMPPHPGSGQSDGRNSNMHAPNYPPGAPPHMATGPPPSSPHVYPSKIGHMPPGVPPGPPYGQAGYQGGHQYPPRPQGPMMQPYPQNFPPGGPQGPQGPQGPPTSMPPGHQYPPRPPHTNHVPPNQPYGYPPFGTQGWGSQNMNQGPPGPGIPSSMMPGGPGMPGKGGSVQMQGQAGQPGGSNVGGPRPHTPPHGPHYLKHHIQQKMGGGYGGPQMYPNGPGMPGMPNSREPSQNNMPPPTSTPQSMAPSSTPSDSGDHSSLNNSNPPSIGPDGNPVVDEASQQSTVSNTSAASGDDRSGTPKPHKDGPLGGPGGPGMPGGMPGGGQHPSSHPPTPINSAPSPGAASMTSQQDEFESINSPGWPRSPSTQTVYANSQPPPPPDIYRPSKPGENITRLYEMSDSPERRAWLDKLLTFMDDNKTPINACPTISKNPLDLYALYLHVRERGGFVEVTKNKQWKDVAAVMGIGASSSGSYTLRKHYMKHILSYECKFDRGGIDPQPIISQIEAAAKKKTTKTISVPSPGSSNSQDSFPPAGSNSSSMDGFSNGPHVPGGPGGPGPYPQYPPSSEFGGHMPQRPSSQSTSGYQGYQGGNYHGYQGMQGYGQGGYHNSGYPPDGRPYQPPGPPNHQGSFQGGYQQPGNYQHPGFAPGQPGFQQDNQFPGGNMYPPNQKPPGASQSPGPPGLNPPAGYQGPRKHRDFQKNEQPPPGWRGNNQFGGPFPPNQNQQGPPQQPWIRPPNDTAPPGTPSSQWSPTRFPGSQPQFTGAGRGWSGGSFTTNVGPRPQGPTTNNKNYIVPPASAIKCGIYGAFSAKHQFPIDSVEAVLPVLARRKRMTRTDLQTCDPWRLLMSLRCGLAAEVTWALDILNILLFDDQTVVYFALHHLPGLLEALIEHLRRGLINMFDICSELELGRDDEATGENKRVKLMDVNTTRMLSSLRGVLLQAEQHDDTDRPWYLRPPPSPTLELDLGKLEEDDPNNKEVILKGATEDFTLITKTGKTVKFTKREGELFMREGSREWDKWEGFSSGVDTWSVGGGECTAHIICTMQSSVPSLLFTRLLPDKVGQIAQVKVEEVEVEVKKEVDEVRKEEIVKDNKKAETVQVIEDKNNGSKTKKDKVVDLLGELKEKKLETLISRDKCDMGKVTESTDKIIRNKVNNAKKSRLDEIFKKLKKEPVDETSDNKISSKETNEKACTLNKDTEVRLDPNVTIKQEPNSDKSPEKEVEKTKELPRGKVDGKEKIERRENEKLERRDSEKLERRESEKQERRESERRESDKLERRESSGSTKRESGSFKRPYEDLEEESWGPDEASLSTTTEGQDWLARRVMCVGTVIRNLSFIPGNEEVMSKSASLLALLGKTILLHHEHPQRTPSTAHYDRDEEADLSDWCSSLAPDTHWWWPYLHHVHENTLVTLANMAGYLDLSIYPEEISRPLLNGLLHWATCPASYGQDPLPGSGTSSQASLSPQRLALETLVKLCVLDQNTDLVLATPPFSRLDNLCGQLTRFMCRGEDQVLREFSINLLHYFSAADSGVARVIAMQNGCVSLLVAFIEEAEAAAMNVANVQGVSALKENPELMGTSLDMVRRSANTLVHLSRVPANARALANTENRLLTLVMSQILDTYVASQLSQVLFNVAQVQVDFPQFSPPPTPPPPSSPPPSTAQVPKSNSTPDAPMEVESSDSSISQSASVATPINKSVNHDFTSSDCDKPNATQSSSSSTPTTSALAVSTAASNLTSPSTLSSATINNSTVTTTTASTPISASSAPASSPAPAVTAVPATTPFSQPSSAIAATPSPISAAVPSLNKVSNPNLTPANTPIFNPQINLSLKPTNSPAIAAPTQTTTNSESAASKCESLGAAITTPVPLEAPAAKPSS